MRKWIMLVVLCALGLLPSATKANTETRAVTQAVKPALKCTVASVKLVGTSLVATGSCKVGAKSVPAKWTWIQKSADLSGSACQFGSGRGTGKRSNLLAYPAGVPRISGSALPGLLDATFTVTARWNKKTVKRSKSFHKTTADSHVLCGAPPKLVSLDGPTPSALTWATPPTFDGTILRASAIQSRGNGQCRLSTVPVRTQYQYLVYGAEIICANGYNAHISVNVSYSTGGLPECSALIASVSSYTIPSNSGIGGIYLQMAIATWDNDNKQLPYTDENMWRIPEWVTVSGSVNPCSTFLRR